MSIPACFSFENSQVRTLGTPDLPLFVAIDVASALGFQKPSNAVSQHVDSEDLIKQEITDKLGRAQTVNCVNESGLYALIFGSKLESAKRFKRWVTSEVLPAIRKTGRYEAQETITPAEQRAIQREVAIRAHKTSSNTAPSRHATRSPATTSCRALSSKTASTSSERLSSTCPRCHTPRAPTTAAAHTVACTPSPRARSFSPRMRPRTCGLSSTTGDISSAKTSRPSSS